MNYKLGRKPARIDSRTLKLEKYLDATLTAPALLDWGSKVNDWKMMLNDQLSCCTCSSAGHFIMNWSSNASQLIIPSDNDILKAYEIVGGYYPSAPLINGVNQTDNGAVELDVLKYWQNTGIAGHKIGAFVSINPLNFNHLKLAIWLLGGIYAGVYLTPTDMNTVGNLWTPSGDNPIGGHAIPSFGYDETTFKFVTWGKIQTASNNWVARQMDECYALISQDWIENNSKAPSGFDIQQLTDDLNQIQN